MAADSKENTLIVSGPNMTNDFNEPSAAEGMTMQKTPKVIAGDLTVTNKSLEITEMTKTSIAIEANVKEAKDDKKAPLEPEIVDEGTVAREDERRIDQPEVQVNIEEQTASPPPEEQTTSQPPDEQTTSQPPEEQTTSQPPEEQTPLERIKKPQAATHTKGKDSKEVIKFDLKKKSTTLSMTDRARNESKLKKNNIRNVGRDSSSVSSKGVPTNFKGIENFKV